MIEAEKMKVSPHTKPEPPTGKPELSDFGIASGDLRNVDNEWGLGPLILSIWVIGVPTFLITRFTSEAFPGWTTVIFLGAGAFFIVINWSGFSDNPSHETLKAFERYKEAEKDYNKRYRAYEEKLRDYELNHFEHQLDEAREYVDGIEKEIRQTVEAELISGLESQKTTAKLHLSDIKRRQKKERRRCPPLRRRRLRRFSVSAQHEEFAPLPDLYSGDDQSHSSH